MLEEARRRHLSLYKCEDVLRAEHDQRPKGKAELIAVFYLVVSNDNSSLSGSLKPEHVKTGNLAYVGDPSAP